MLRFGEVKVQTQGAQHNFEVAVHLHDLNPDWVSIELYANGMDGDKPVRQEMTLLRPLDGEPNGGIYVASVPATRPASRLHGPHHPALRGRGRAPGSEILFSGSGEPMPISGETEDIP